MSLTNKMVYENIRHPCKDKHIYHSSGKWYFYTILYNIYVTHLQELNYKLWYNTMYVLNKVYIRVKIN